MPTILVTGGAGFIGSHVAQVLAKRGDRVVVIDNFNAYYDSSLKEARYRELLGSYSIPLFRMDIGNAAELGTVFDQYHFDAICHLAAQAGVRYSLENPDAYIQTNIVGTHNLLEAARNHAVGKFIFASSSSVYGANEKTPFAETDPVDRPISLYAATKKANEVEAYAYHHLFGINVTGIRFFAVYGPWGRPDMAYFKFTERIAAGKPIDVYNNGKMARDFTYIDDVIAGVVAAIDRCVGYEIFNLGNNHPVPLEIFIGLIEKKLGKVAVKNYLPMQPGDAIANCADISKAKKFLGYNPQIDVTEGMNRFIDWYKSYYHV